MGLQVAHFGGGGRGMYAHRYSIFLGGGHMFNWKFQLPPADNQTKDKQILQSIFKRKLLFLPPDHWTFVLMQLFCETDPKLWPMIKWQLITIFFFSTRKEHLLNWRGWHGYHSESHTHVPTFQLRTYTGIDTHTWQVRVDQWQNLKGLCPLWQVLYTLNWLTFTPKTHFAQFCLNATFYFLSWDKNIKYVTLGMRLLWKCIRKSKLV